MTSITLDAIIVFTACNPDVCVDTLKMPIKGAFSLSDSFTASWQQWATKRRKKSKR